MSFAALKQFLPPRLHPLASSYEAELEALLQRDQQGSALPRIHALTPELAPWVLAFWLGYTWSRDESVITDAYVRYGGALVPALVHQMKSSWWVSDVISKFLMELGQAIKAGKDTYTKEFYDDLPDAAVTMVGSSNRNVQRQGVVLINTLGSKARKAVEQAAVSHTRITSRREFAKVAMENGWTVAKQKVVAGDADRLGLIRKLVAAWGRNRHPELSHWIHVVSRCLPSPPFFDKVSEREAWWLTTAKTADPGLLGQLVQFAWPKQWKDGHARVRQFEKFPPDPRICETLLQVQEQQLYDSWGSNPFHRSTNALLIRVASSEFLDRAGIVNALQGNRWQSESIFPKDWLASFSQAAAYQPLSEAEQALIQEAQQMLGSEDRSELLKELYDQVYQYPEQDEPRLVLADLLTEIGDPRGEFIQIQCGPQTATNTRKAKSLLKHHQDKWEHQLPGAVAGTVLFERGFPVRAKLSLVGNPVLQLQQSSWSTVQAIEVMWRGGLDMIPRILELPSLQSITELYGFSGQRLPLPLPPQARRLKKLSAFSLPPNWISQLTSLELLCTDYTTLQNSDGCPSLKTLYIPVGDDTHPNPKMLIEKFPHLTQVSFFISGIFYQIEGWEVVISIQNAQVVEARFQWRQDVYWQRNEFLASMIRPYISPGIPVVVEPGTAHSGHTNTLKTQLEWVRPEDLKWQVSESTSA